MDDENLGDAYRSYLACLNRQDWARLGDFVHNDVRHNSRELGLSGYRAMLEKDFREIPDLRFNVDIVIADPPCLAARLRFECTPVGTFLGLPINGRKVSFAENVFYEFREGKIWSVWSIIDKAAIEAQL